MMPVRVLVSAGEASGDLYASLLVEALRELWPDAGFFGCTGPRMRGAGVRTVVDAASLAVVGIAEVAVHIPRIYREYRRLLASVDAAKPDFAVLTDSPDFHLRVAKRLKAAGIPVVYLVAPQVWAWRKHRLPLMRRVIDRLLCIFPFEEAFFVEHGIPAVYIGHPLARIVKPAMRREDFFRKHGLDAGRPLIAVLPGSRRGEAARHLPVLAETVDRIRRNREAAFLLPASATTGTQFFRERIGGSPIQVIQGENWDALAHSDLALAASGTVTIEAALLGTPMVTYYRVSTATWLIGRPLVRVPFFSMVNLVAGRQIVPELIQTQFTSAALAHQTVLLLDDSAARARMKKDLGEVAAKLATAGNPMETAAAVIEDMVKEQVSNAS